MRPGIVASWETAPRGPLPPLVPEASVIYLVVREGGRPVGRLVREPPYPERPEEWYRLAGEAAADGRRAAEGEEHGLPAGEFSVVVATRDRPGDLDRCLAALRALPEGPGEIVVADSASSDLDAVAAAARKHGAVLVRLERPGLSLARNAGARAATRPLLAFLDDDCRADPWYLRGLGRGFASPAAWIVTGQLIPVELETEAQLLFLRYAHMDRRGFVPRRFRADRRESRHWPLDAWRMGSGGNLAIRRDAFDRLGGFSPSLGLGTPSLGGEDLYILWSAIRAGGEVVYRPDAMAWHRHHRDLDSLRRVLFGYGAGHRAFLRAAAGSGASPLRLADYRASFWFDRGKRLIRAWTGRWNVPAGLVLREAAGQLSGGRLARRAEREAS